MADHKSKYLGAGLTAPRVQRSSKFNELLSRFQEGGAKEIVETPSSPAPTRVRRNSFSNREQPTPLVRPVSCEKWGGKIDEETKSPRSSSPLSSGPRSSNSPPLPSFHPLALAAAASSSSSSPLAQAPENRKEELPARRHSLPANSIKAAEEVQEEEKTKKKSIPAVSDVSSETKEEVSEPIVSSVSPDALVSSSSPDDSPVPSEATPVSQESPEAGETVSDESPSPPEKHQDADLDSSSSSSPASPSPDVVPLSSSGSASQEQEEPKEVEVKEDEPSSEPEPVAVVEPEVVSEPEPEPVAESEPVAEPVQQDESPIEEPQAQPEPEKVEEKVQVVEEPVAVSEPVEVISEPEPVEAVSEPVEEPEVVAEPEVVPEPVEEVPEPVQEVSEVVEVSVSDPEPVPEPIVVSDPEPVEQKPEADADSQTRSEPEETSTPEPEPEPTPSSQDESSSSSSSVETETESSSETSSSSSSSGAEEEAPKDFVDDAFLAEDLSEYNLGEFDNYVLTLKERPGFEFFLIDLVDQHVPQRQFIQFCEQMKTNDRWRTVKVMKLDSNDFQFQVAKMLGSILADPNHSSSLKQLDLKWNLLGASGARAISSGIQANMTLTSLNIDGNELGEKGAEALGAGLAANQTLKYLELRDNSINDEGAESLAKGLESNKSLLLLDLSSNAIGSEGVESIVKYLLVESPGEKKSLQTLILNNNPLFDEGGFAIASGLESNASLLSLQLKQCSIETDGSTAIANALLTGNTTLKELDFNLNYPHVAGEILMNDLLLNRTNFYIEWKDPGSESNWDIDEIQEIISHYGARDILYNFLKGFSLSPLVETNKLLGSFEIEEDDVARDFLGEVMSTPENLVVGMRMLITMLNQGVEEEEDIHELPDSSIFFSEQDNPVDELPSLHKALYERLDELFALLDVDLDESFSLPGGMHRPLGPIRLLIVQFACGLLHDTHIVINQRLIELRVIDRMLALFDQFPNHNILHHELCNFVTLCLRTETLKMPMLQDSQLLDFIIDKASEEWPKTSNDRKGYSGHLAILTRIVSRFAFDEDVTAYIEEHKSWNVYLEFYTEYVAASTFDLSNDPDFTSDDQGHHDADGQEDEEEEEEYDEIYIEETDEFEEQEEYETQEDSTE
eukprot:TRINITY_DN5622_c1_g1_i1.p1 TRINITY_DN5622_c1_g1~~TRINITY_DN5622_c1_g1_i1.p1  ORF type:complete len:1180 (-),score=570.69 TRINITY_DN5622_c1_g1_i1:264-3656(-)